jgi:two-component system phosphate regulon sensor histidine kinase PhoR
LKPVRTSLFWKLGLTYLALLLAVLASVDFYASRILRQDYLRAADERLESLGQLAIKRPPPFEDPAALAGWAEWMSRSGARVTVIAAAGGVLADSAHDPETMENHSNRPEFRQAMASGQGKSVRHSVTLDRDLVYWAVRLPRGTGAVVVRFALPLAEINSSLAAIRGRLLAASLLILVLGVGISLLFSHRFSHRVDRLKQFSRRVAAGDFRLLPASGPRDELAELAGTLNETAANLAATIGSLTEERNRSAAILRSMVEGVAVIDVGQHLAFCNEAFAEIAGMSPARAEGRPMLEVLRKPLLVELVRRALGGEEGLTGEITVGGGRQRVFAATVSPVPAQEGGPAAPAGRERVIGAVLVLHEITELRRLEQVRTDFVANVSHELKTPLTSIQGFAETLLAGALDDPEHNRRFVEIIRNHALRLSRLTDDLLKLSRIEAGKMLPEFQPVRLAEMLAGEVETVRPRAEQKQLGLEVRCSSDLPPVRGDAALLQEVLRNLLDNAVLYTPAGGRIEVSAEQREGFAVVTVSDTGIGIPEAEQTRIFERFYRVDAARSRELGSTGLGLAIAKHIVEAHGGRIGVESAVGQGSKFYFTIPLSG